LNGRERIETALELGTPDRVPIISGMDALIARVAGKTVREYYSNAETYVKANLSAWKKFGYDEIFAWWPHVLPEAMGSKLTYRENDYPTIKSPRVKTEEDVDNLVVPDPESDGRLPLVLRAMRILDRKVGNQVCLCGGTYGLYTEMGNLIGFERLLVETMKKSDILKKLTKILLDAKIRFGEAMVNAGCQLIWMSEPMASPPILPIDTFEEAVLPAWMQLTTAFKKMGVYTLWHPCGRARGEYQIFEQLLRGNADAISFSETTDMKTVKEMFTHKKCVAGNLDPVAISRAAKGSIEREVKKIMKDAADGGGFIFTPGCSIPLDASLTNVEEMVRSARKFGRYL
jgi:uroporphyrinogen decarboxylase